MCIWIKENVIDIDVIVRFNGKGSPSDSPGLVLKFFNDIVNIIIFYKMKQKKNIGIF